MTDFKNPASQILWNYLGFLDRVYGMYGDACSGVEIFGKKIEDATKPDQRNNSIFIGAGDPNRPEAKYRHSVKISDFINRNKKDGENQQILSQSCIIFIYSVWDTSTRPRYAETLNLKQQDVSSDLFGDLRFYRHSIIHNNAILEKQPKVLQFVKVGEFILLRRSEVEKLFSMLFEEIGRINKEFTGEVFNLSFERNLNPPIEKK